MPDTRGMERRKYKIQPAEVWERVRQDYLAGLGAEEVAAKYDVTVHSLRARATKQGWSRYLHAPTAPVDPPPPPPALFDITDVGDHPAGLAQATLKASSRALAAGLWNEARTLAGLAESYRKMAERPDPMRAGMTVETAPLELIYDVLTTRSHVLHERFDFPDGSEAEPIKIAYRDLMRRRILADSAVRSAEIGRRGATSKYVRALEQRLAEAGLPPVEETERSRRIRRERDVVISPTGTIVTAEEWNRMADEQC